MGALKTRSCKAVFTSRVPQRTDAAAGNAPLASAKPDPDAANIGPGTYNSMEVAVGQATWKPWLIEPMRMGSAFASTTQKSEMPRPLTADVDVGRKYGMGAQYLSSISGAAPGSRSQGWGRGERKPPHFHVPFRAYPGLLGEPRGRDVGLDRFYNIDSTGATPIALNGTLEVNMRRHPRHYAATFKSKQPARPIRDLDAGAGFLGPGSYPTPKGCIQLKEPSRPSSAFIPFSGGMYAGVGGSYADYLNAKPNIREFDYGQPRGS